MQKKAIRLIFNKSYNAHSEPLFKLAKILPFNSLIKFFNLQTMQQYIQGFLPQSFSSVWIRNYQRRQDQEFITNDDLRRTLRNSENINIPFARLSFSMRQPFINLPKTWTEFNNFEIKIIRNKPEFNFKLKELLLSQLSSTVTCSRLLCPACHLSQ